MSESLLIASDRKISREELALVPTPAGTATHKPIPHVEVVNALIETLGFRHICGRPGRIRGLARRHEDVRRHRARSRDARRPVRARRPQLP